MPTSKTHKLPGYLISSLSSGVKSNSDPTPKKGFYVIPSGHRWEDDSWELAEDLHIEVKTPPEEMVAVHLPGPTGIWLRIFLGIRDSGPSDVSERLLPVPGIS